MAKSPYFTQANVFPVCDRLNSAGDRPTVRKVREATGIRSGSDSTVQRLIHQWYEQARRVDAETLDAGVAIHEDLPAEIITASRTLYEAIQKGAIATLETTRRELEHDRDWVREELARLTDQREMIEERIRVSDQRSHDMQVEAREAHSRCHHLEQTAANLHGENTVLKGRIQLLEEQNAREIRALEDRCKELQGMNDMANSVVAMLEKHQLLLTYSIQKTLNQLQAILGADTLNREDLKALVDQALAELSSAPTATSEPLGKD
jgi:chromosome segregation ATPase